uniref:Transmembrane protein n=1 Tax=Neospora caninum (strain Liverpool) TaxID=572307 RepID=A0A0F7U3W7_NEOCL|nr:TPA: hypothetical protein BN1204_003640 [Neospora caninum Liverpool]
MGTSTLDASVGPSSQPFQLAALPSDRGFSFESERWILAVLVIIVIELAGLLLYLVGRTVRRRCTGSCDESCPKANSCASPESPPLMIGEVTPLPQKKGFSTPKQDASLVHSECSTFEALPNDLRLSSSHSGDFVSPPADAQNAGVEPEPGLACAEDAVPWPLKSKEKLTVFFDSDSSISSLSRVFPAPLGARPQGIPRVEEKAKSGRSRMLPAALLAALEGVSDSVSTHAPEGDSNKRAGKDERSAADRSEGSAYDLKAVGKRTDGSDDRRLQCSFPGSSVESLSSVWKAAGTLHDEDDISDMRERRMYPRRSMLQCRLAMVEDLLLPSSSLELVRSLRCEAVDPSARLRSFQNSRASRFSGGASNGSTGSVLVASSQDSLESLSATEAGFSSEDLQKRGRCGYADERQSGTFAARGSPTHRGVSAREDRVTGDEESAAERRDQVDREGLWRRATGAESPSKVAEKTRLNKTTPPAKGEFEHVLERAMKLKQLDIAITVHDSLRAANVKIDRRSYTLLVQIAMSRKDVALQSQWLLEMIDEGHAIDASWLDRLLAAASVCDPPAAAALQKELESRSASLSPECLEVLKSAKTYISVGANLLRRAVGGTGRRLRHEEKKARKGSKGEDEEGASDASLSHASGEGKREELGENEAGSGGQQTASGNRSPSSLPTLNPHAPEFVPLTLRSLSCRTETLGVAPYAAISPSFSPLSVSSQAATVPPSCAVAAPALNLNAFGTTSSALSPALSKKGGVASPLSTLRLLQAHAPPCVATPDAVAASLLAVLSSTSLSSVPEPMRTPVPTPPGYALAARAEEVKPRSAAETGADAEKTTLRLQMQEMYTRAKEGRGKGAHAGSTLGKDAKEKERTNEKREVRSNELEKASCLDQFKAFNVRMSGALNAPALGGRRPPCTLSSDREGKKEVENGEKSVRSSLPNSGTTSAYHGDDERGASDESAQSE